MKRTPKRSEIEKKYIWATEDLYSSDELCEKEIEESKNYCGTLDKMQGTLGESGENLLAYFRLNDEITVKIEKLANDCMRKSDEDTGNSKYLTLKGKFMNMYVGIRSADAFAVPEIISIPDGKIDEFYKTTPDLLLYKRLIDMILVRKPHTLPSSEEGILASMSEIFDAPSDIGSMFRNADLKFPDVTDGKGDVHALTQGTYISMVSGNDRVLRKNAFDALYHTYGAFRNTTAAILDAQEKQLKVNASLRKYSSALEAALSANEIPVEVYRNLIETVHNNMGYMHKYMKLRKKLMGVDELHMYDIYPSLVADADEKIKYEDAQKTVLEALAPLGSDYCSVIKEGFDNRWIDVYENEGKRGGAYSAGAMPHPYVLLNYDETLDSMFTLAHEMGHALHSYLSLHTQPTAYADYVIFVAEVASTCNEALLMADLLSKTADRKKKAYLLNHFLEQFRTTLYRQTMFAEFELKISELVASGRTLTADELCSVYHDLNVLYYGDDVIIDPEVDMEWARIPHFFMNFYVFQYATGFSAAMALSQRILSEGEPAVKEYLGFLSGGSSKDPISLLKGAGVDMTTAAPIESALSQFGKLIDEFEELMKD